MSRLPANCWTDNKPWFCLGVKTVNWQIWSLRKLSNYSKMWSDICCRWLTLPSAHTADSGGRRAVCGTSSRRELSEPRCSASQWRGERKKLSHGLFASASIQYYLAIFTFTDYNLEELSVHLLWAGNGSHLLNGRDAWTGLKTQTWRIPSAYTAICTKS